MWAEKQDETKIHVPWFTVYCDAMSAEDEPPKIFLNHVHLQLKLLVII